MNIFDHLIGDSLGDGHDGLRGDAAGCIFCLPRSICHRRLQHLWAQKVNLKRWAGCTQSQKRESPEGAVWW